MIITGNKHVKLLLPAVISCFLFFHSNAQQIAVAKNVSLKIIFSGKDSSFNEQALKLQYAFVSQPAAMDYVYKLSSLLASKGYPVASVDSVWADQQTVYAAVYAGTKYNWVRLNPGNIEKQALEQSGYMEKNFENKPINIIQLQQLQQRLLNYYEKTGYPFAAVFLDSVQINGDKIDALLKADKGVLYHIDSIRVYGKVKISKNFLQHYLGIFKGSVYNKEKLQLVDKRIRELPYLSPVQPSDLSMLGIGSILNLYLQARKSSQLNFVVGFLPGSGESGKLQLTGDVNLNLKNQFATGESILLKWQQLQKKSPRLNLGYNQPYIFNTAFGFDFLFDLFKKDSSFLQINAQLGIEYVLSAKQSGKVFVQWQTTNLLSGAVDTNQVKIEKRLPQNIDVSSSNIGLNYDWTNTNYKFNPRKGNELGILASVGIKRIRKNNDIVSIKDPAFNYASLYDSIRQRSYQLRVKLSAAHYFPVGKASAIKAGVNAGVYSSPDIFRNELFQIGGYKLLRGFDEESIYATQYAVLTAEYRSLISLNSYLFFFVDGGLVKNKYQAVDVKNNFIGGGLGLVYETKLGLLNISYAMGKRDDVKFNISNASKLHFGYVNYF